MLGAWNLVAFALWTALPPSDYYATSAHRTATSGEAAPASKGRRSMFPGVLLRALVPALGSLSAPGIMVGQLIPL